MTLSELDIEQLALRLQTDGIVLSAAPFNFELRTSYPRVARALSIAYADYPIALSSSLIDFSLVLRPVAGIRRFLRPLMNLEIDGYTPFDALPANQVFPLLEWGMNWCVTSTAHHWVMCHSAVLARGDHAVILPAPPGSGKSTLCAALMLSGWRLLSDEMALIDSGTSQLIPFVRPVSLKNASIDLIKKRYPQASLTPRVHDTIKGTVAHLQPSLRSVLESQRSAGPKWLIFPRYEPDVPFNLLSIAKAEAMVDLAANTFNFAALGPKAVAVLAGVVDACNCFRLSYSELDHALECINQLSSVLSPTDLCLSAKS